MMETDELKSIAKLFKAAELVVLEIKGQRIALGRDYIAAIIAALERE